jgi:phosphohistidine phosphatase
MKTLFINRHAKSSWKHDALRDFDRPLNKRGLRDAPFMAQIFSEREKSIDAIVSSPANRAITTAKHFSAAMGWLESRIKQNESIYGASASSLMDIISGFDDDWNRVIMFGHNPGFSYLVHELSGEYFEMPTCGIAKITFDAETWVEVIGSVGKLEFTDWPKNHLE